MTTPLVGYGRDIWCGAEGLRTGRYASGRTLLVQALYRRLVTPRGTLHGTPEDDNYGIDLADYVGAVGYATAVVTIPSLVQAELSKDDRVLSVYVQSAVSSTTSAGLTNITLSIEVTPADESDTFTMTLSVSDAAVLLIGVQ